MAVAAQAHSTDLGQADRNGIRERIPQPSDRLSPMAAVDETLRQGIGTDQSRRNRTWFPSIQRHLECQISFRLPPDITFLDGFERRLLCILPQTPAAVLMEETPTHRCLLLIIHCLRV